MTCRGALFRTADQGSSGILTMAGHTKDAGTEISFTKRRRTDQQVARLPPARLPSESAVILDEFPVLSMGLP